MNVAKTLRRFAWLAGVGGLLALTTSATAAQGEVKPAATEDRGPAQVEAWRQSIALVKGERGHGSGFVVRPGVVVTNSHVIRRELLADIRVRFISPTDPNPKELKVKLLYENSRRDLALLEVIKEQPALKLAHNHVFAEGRQVLVLGNPGQDQGAWARINKVAEGTTVGIARAFDEPFYELKVPDTTPGGFSGGPVLDRDSGKVIGILTGNISTIELAGNRQRIKATSVSFCVPVQALHDALYKLDLPAPEKAKTAADCQKRHYEALIVEELRHAQKRSTQNLHARIDLAGQNQNPFPAPGIAIKDRKIAAREQIAHEASLARIRAATQRINNYASKGVNDLIKNYEATHKLHASRHNALLTVIDCMHRLHKKHEQLMKQVVADLNLCGTYLEGINPD